MPVADRDTRFAIYFVPDRKSGLYQFGASVLGYDCYAEQDAVFHTSAPSGWRGSVDGARTYGFHATLKAPFRLLAGATLIELVAAFDNFAQGQRPLGLVALQMRNIGSFIALTPSAPNAAIDALAAACVRFFEPFRAPLDEKDRQRRLAANLTARQAENLDRWGYPYVFEDFRFHMTLTGPLPDAERPQALEWLRSSFNEKMSLAATNIDRIVIARQTSGQPFVIIREALLSGR
jgi:hypothetical protein